MSDLPPADDPSRSSAEDTVDPPSVEPSVAPRESPPPVGPLYQAGDIITQKYQLTRVLGAGGMGAVWLARNLKLDVDVAIKLIRHELGTAEASHRLLQEARAAARIGHRSIVRVFDFGETELDDPFIVMEVLTGESLRELLERKGRLPAANAVRTMLPIASALAEAHASGIVHRDLKPENIMLVPDKSGGALPKLLDFGIAKFCRADDEHHDRGRTRFAAGTPDYMAPEQAGGHDDVQEAADVWALGVILYEAITGHVPFAGPNFAALIFAIMTADPSPTHEQAAGDPELWAILRGALGKRDVERPSMRAFGVALAEWALSRGIDSDITGTSLAAHWLGDAALSPFSEAPPPVSEDPSAAYDIAIPRPAGLPGRLRAGDLLPLTEAPPPEDLGASGAAAPPPPRRRAGAFLLGAALVASAAIGLGVIRGRASPIPAPSAAIVAAPAPAPAPSASASESPVVAASAPPAIASEAPAGSVTPATSVVKARGAPAPSPRAGAKAPPRKGGLPIAKQPNF